MNGTSIGTFDWLMPQKIVFGDGRLAEIGELAAGFGRQVCLVTGGQSLRAAGHLERIAEQLDKRELQWLHLTIDHEPTVEAVDELAAQAAEFHPHAIVAVGGGSVLDAGKAVAALLTNGGQAVDYLEGVGCGRVLAAPSLPVIAAPTTAGTGSEATKNAVIGDRARTFKKSMRGDGLMPTVALVDPELTHGCPAAVTAACGMDALTQLLEAFASRRAHPLSDALAMQGLDLAGSLTRLAETPGEGTDRRPLREEMSLAALLGGICLANVGLGAVHGLVSPLGAYHPMPHGAGCAALLPAVVRANARRAWEEEGAALVAVQKYACALEFLTDQRTPDDPLEGALALAGYLADLNRSLSLPGLAHYGVTRADFPRIVAGSRGSSMKTNPVELSDDELTAILEESL